MKSLFVAIAIALFFNSCATHFGMVSSGTTEKDIQYVDLAIGSTQTKQVLGLGGMSKDALALEAKKSLMQNRPLKTGEKYLNFTIDFKKSFWPLVSSTKVIMSADVVKPLSNANESVYSIQYLKKMGMTKKEDKLYNVGDSVLIGVREQGTIISIKGKKAFTVLYSTKSGNYRIKKISSKYVYALKKSYKEINLGDVYSNTAIYLGLNNMVTGQVVGFGLKTLLVKLESGSCVALKYHE